MIRPARLNLEVAVNGYCRTGFWSLSANTVQAAALSGDQSGALAHHCQAGAYSTCNGDMTKSSSPRGGSWRREKDCDKRGRRRTRQTPWAQESESISICTALLLLGLQITESMPCANMAVPCVRTNKVASPGQRPATTRKSGGYPAAPTPRNPWPARLFRPRAER